MYEAEKEDEAYYGFIDRTDTIIKRIKENDIDVDLKDEERWFIEEALKITQMQRKAVNGFVSAYGYHEDTTDLLKQLNDQLIAIGNLIVK